MTLIELLRELLAYDDERLDADLPGWLDKRGIDPETPIPTWNETAQAWEI